MKLIFRSKKAKITSLLLIILYSCNVKNEKELYGNHFYPYHGEIYTNKIILPTKDTSIFLLYTDRNPIKISERNYIKIDDINCTLIK